MIIMASSTLWISDWLKKLLTSDELLLSSPDPFETSVLPLLPRKPGTVCSLSVIWTRLPRTLLVLPIKCTLSILSWSIESFPPIPFEGELATLDFVYFVFFFVDFIIIGIPLYFRYFVQFFFQVLSIVLKHNLCFYITMRPFEMYYSYWKALSLVALLVTPSVLASIVVHTELKLKLCV